MGTNSTISDQYIGSGMLSSCSSTEDNDRSSISTSDAESSKERLLKSRCKSEKKRRDKLNLFINDLQSMLSPGSNKRLDKLTVLKYAVNYLKMHNDFTVNINGEGKLSKSFFLPCDELGELMLEVLNGFILVINEDARFVYIADVVEKVLGLKASSLTEKTIHSLVHEEDRDRLTEEIMSGILNEVPGLCTSSSFMDILSDSHKNQLISINFRILVDKKDCEPKYQTLHCTGKWYSSKEFGGNSYGNKVLVLVACLKSDGIREVCADGNDSVTSFTSKHSLDGCFLHADTNCPGLTGYLPYEVLGKSIYSFVHPDDLSDLCTVHEQVTSSPSTEPTALFIRFLSKGEEWLIFEAQLQLVLKKQMSMHPNYISIKFTLATEAATRDFRKLAKEKASDTERLLYGIHSEAALPTPVSPEKEKQPIQEEVEVALLPEIEIPLKNEPLNIPEKVVEIEETYSLKENNDDEDDNTQLYEFTKHLHSQLETKHEFILKSFAKQKKQIETIGTIMKEYAFMMEAPSFKVHYKQQADMFEYFKYVLKKQQRQQEYLFKQLKSKRKQLEIHQRAMKLRNIAVQKQKIISERKKVPKEPNLPQLNANNMLYGANKRSENLMNNANSPSASVVFTTNCRPVSRNSGILAGDLSNLNNTFAVSPSISQQTLGNNQVNNMLDQRLPNVNNFQSQLSQQRKDMSKNELSFNQNTASNTAQLQGLIQSTLLQHQMQLTNQQNMVNPSLLPTDRNTNSQFLNAQMNTNQVNNQLNEAGASEIQSAMSNQILVHLQILQKTILTQLQTAVEVRQKTGADFSQILPVLQQLQQLQQYIIEQQTQPQPANQPEPSAPNTNNTKFPESQPSTTNNFSGPSRSVAGMEALMMQSLGSIDSQICSSSSNTQQLPTSDSSKVAYSGSGSAFGDIMSSKRELNKIKKVFSYEEQKMENDVPLDGDCFQNLPSPELKNLICPDQNEADNNANNNDNDNSEDDMKKSKKLESENVSTFQPLLVSQQQLEQLQQYQRMQIHNQQEQTINMIQSQIEESLTQANPTMPMIETQEIANQTPSSTREESISPAAQVTTSTSSPGLNGQDYTYSLADFTDQNMNDNSNWIAPENEEMMNMFLTDGNDFFC